MGLLFYDLNAFGIGTMTVATLAGSPYMAMKDHESSCIVVVPGSSPWFPFGPWQGLSFLLLLPLCSSSCCCGDQGPLMLGDADVKVSVCLSYLPAALTGLH